MSGGADERPRPARAADPATGDGTGRDPGPELQAEVERVAAASRLLVACDFDGTVAPIVSKPAAARGDPVALERLSRIGALPGTEAVLVSGRSRAALARLSGEPEGVRLIGSHGAETGEEPSLDPGAAERLEWLASTLEGIAERHPGAEVERKPASVALHYRNVAPAERDAVASAAEAAAEGREGVRRLHGKMVVELLVVPADKGAALTGLREALGADVVVYLGDDVTDEEAFAALGPDDLTVKVGDGDTAARYRIHDPDGVREFLGALLRAREEAVRRRGGARGADRS